MVTTTVYLEDVHISGQRYAFDCIDERRMPFLKKLDKNRVEQRRSTENDYDSD